jgi:hypothetical protein
MAAFLMLLGIYNSAILVSANNELCKSIYFRSTSIRKSKVEELEQLNQSKRDRDKMKDDAIAQLSDQLVVITARLQELEKTITRIYHNLINFSG